ncbi:hypothetical protein L7F22_018484 [Adiantum nelumboides]|nr:hypothetical protein [Adiantum nelumboides]
MRSQRYKKCNADRCLYTGMASDKRLSLYVDDMFIAGRNVKQLDALQQGLHECFDMKDLGNANHIPGMCIFQIKGKVFSIYLKKITSIKFCNISIWRRKRSWALHCLHM